MPRLFELCLIIAAAFVLACGDDPPPEDAPFPADYRSTYREVRDCRGSGDHELNNIRVLADPSAVGPYEMRNAPFPEGSIVLKEEYDFADTACSGAIKQWTLMIRDSAASSSLGWQWYEVGADRRITETNTPRCYGCHAGCGAPPDGYEGTCAVP
jgi:hypothetical protein